MAAAGEAELFTYRSARSGSFLAGIIAVLLIEGLAIHLLFVGRIPVLAWSLSALNVLTILWLVRDYRALGAGAVSVGGGGIRLAVGRRYDVSIPPASVERVLQPSHRDLPVPGTNQGRDYVNLTKPATPNVLIVLAAPMRVRLPGGLHRDATRLALRVDDPSGFITAANRARAGS